MITIGIDLGGTRIKAVAIDPDGKILEQVYEPTQDGNDAIWKNTVIETVQKIKKTIATDITAVGISAPGLPDEKNTCIAHR